jgi:hypothetical protein
MAIFCSASSFFNGAEVSFQFYGCNRLTWHLHLLEPCGQGSLIRSLHNAYDLSLRQVEKTSIRLHRRVVLGGLCHLVDLFAREGTSRRGMAAHEFRHNICSFLGLLFWRGGSMRMRIRISGRPAESKLAEESERTINRAPGGRDQSSVDAKMYPPNKKFDRKSVLQPRLPIRVHWPVTASGSVLAPYYPTPSTTRRSFSHPRIREVSLEQTTCDSTVRQSGSKRRCAQMARSQGFQYRFS